MFRDLAGSMLKQILPRFFTKAFLFVCILIAGFLVIEWMANRAEGFANFTVFTRDVRCMSRPSWLASSDKLTTEIIASIQDQLARFPTDNIFSHDLEHTLQTNAVSFSPWIESVSSFQRIFPSRFRLELKLRHPVGLFYWQNHSYFIDRLGVVISMVDHLDRGEVTTALPVITGFGEISHLQEGYPTSNRFLLEGAAVASEIRGFENIEELSHIRILEIDVSRFGNGRPDGVTLFTAGNVRILWGRSARNTRFRGIDPSPTEKTMYLKETVLKNPGFRGIDQITVTFRNAPSSIVPLSTPDD
ncbi:MAG: hypothetical protein ABIK28_02835 [Planctomycetota bacterium]